MANRTRLDRAAETLGVEPKTLRRAISRGDIKGYKIPGSRLIFVDLDELEDAMRIIPTVKR